MPGSLVGGLSVAAPEAAVPSSPARPRFTSALRDFLDAEASSGFVLLAATAIALVWANSPWEGGYTRLWETKLSVDLASWSRGSDLRHLVNDALMTLFFFVVGLEIKRELVVGELRDRRTAALPALAALGGMVVPASLYLVFSSRTPASAGWGIPMATDIAFAVGVLAAFGSRLPPSLRLFLLTLAIVDDIGAILVIAVFYSAGLNGTALVAVIALLGVIVLVRRAGVQSTFAFAILGTGVWLATYESGVHATIAGVALGLLTPATQRAGGMRSVAESLERRLHPFTSFVIIPLFALANAGVAIKGDSLDAPGAGSAVVAVVVGLIVGKFVGVLGASWLGVRFRLGRLPEETRWPHIAGVAALAGIGFTVSLFIANLAFDAPALVDAAKIGVLAGSVAAALLGTLVLLLSGRSRRRLAETSANG